MLVIFRDEEFSFLLIELLQKVDHLLVPFLLLLRAVMLIVPPWVFRFTFSLGDENRLHLAVINIAAHYKALFRDVFDFGHHLVSVEIVATFSVLVHVVFAKSVVPRLEFVENNLVVHERAFDMAVTVEA